MSWPETTIITDAGDRQTAIAPIIISASRSTDIPAFYGAWFRRRIEQGYARWINPWNGKSQYVSFEHTRLFVFWTKNPKPFFPLMDELDRRGYGYFFHYTLNDYEEDALEPYVPPVADRIETFRLLSRRLGRERVIWRFDPMLLTPHLGPDHLLQRIRRIGDAVASYADRLIISFMTPYQKVLRNLKNAGVEVFSGDAAVRKHVLAGVGALSNAWGLPVYTCAMEADSGQHGIGKGKCIDDAHVTRVFSHDAVLMAYLREGGGTAKDHGQRPLCGCIRSKDIGCYNTCGHGCRYCYANTSAQRARQMALRSGILSDSMCDHSSYSSSAGMAGSSLS